MKRNDQWLEDLDQLICQVPSLFLPEPVRDAIMLKLENIQEEISEQIELQSTDWEA
jgi:hypothetical protein